MELIPENEIDVPANSSFYLPHHSVPDDTVKTLGILWHPASDMFLFKVNSSYPEVLTKRTLLSIIAKTFDPLGWLAPITVRYKLIMQRLWKHQFQWDEKVPPDIECEWKQLTEDLLFIKSIKISRFLLVESDNQFQLHGFCDDASEKAYAAAIYYRSVLDTGQINVQLVIAKTRVAPLKTISLPRLELCGALLLTKLMDFTCRALNTPISQVYFHTDSTIVLAWIRSHASRWKTFVANRVAKIQTLSSPVQWHHVSGNANPADLATRGVSSSALVTSLWLRGPDLLYNLFLFQQALSAPLLNDSVPEQRCVFQSTTAASHLTDAHDLFYKYSSLTKLKRVVALCLRFVNNCKNSEDQVSGFLKTSELTKDNLGILRVGGRLRHANLAYGFRHPILLPKKHILTHLIVRHYHERLLHAGPQLMQSCIQEQYWIINGRFVIRDLVRKCIKCCKIRASVTNQLMSDLPSSRVSPAPAFLRCGVDYAGPFQIKANRGRGSKSFKAYMALFVCFTTRAIHLELVTDLSADAFIAALKRFISRRGKSSDIYSDCGSNFVGGANAKLMEFERLARSATYNQNVSRYLVDNGIKWHLNVPGAPHMGGLWEAGIKSTKYHLKRVVGEARLTYEEFETFLLHK
ncbi:uncharacterized protein LOC118198513 [Stegodyphus dumicola]|uniref:uncharacterized protein LOC118198513 n=1 Tax=Stegodyphus dumicola TaxID=202533 RepID=UPI0015B342D2|nr:uncharacterized protein LOC118198513 [Stegodyphus dumicola]